MTPQPAVPPSAFSPDLALAAAAAASSFVFSTRTLPMKDSTSLLSAAESGWQACLIRALISTCILVHEGQHKAGLLDEDLDKHLYKARTGQGVMYTRRQGG